jgi:hypothetical protein
MDPPLGRLNIEGISVSYTMLPKLPWLNVVWLGVFEYAWLFDTKTSEELVGLDME